MEFCSSSHLQPRGETVTCQGCSSFSPSASLGWQGWARLSLWRWCLLGPRGHLRGISMGFLLTPAPSKKGGVGGVVDSRQQNELCLNFSFQGPECEGAGLAGGHGGGLGSQRGQTENPEFSFFHSPHAAPARVPLIINCWQPEL